MNVPIIIGKLDLCTNLNVFQLDHPIGGVGARSPCRFALAPKIHEEQAAKNCMAKTSLQAAFARSALIHKNKQIVAFVELSCGTRQDEVLLPSASPFGQVVYLLSPRWSLSPRVGSHRFAFLVLGVLIARTPVALALLFLFVSFSCGILEVDISMTEVGAEELHFHLVTHIQTQIPFDQFSFH